MAKPKNQTVETGSLESQDPTVKKPRLTRLIIKNFRCIGSIPVEIELDDIVVLVGANNVGKSTILKAYELVMSQGSSREKLKIEDFYNNIIDENNLPEIQLYTIVYDNSPGEKWITKLENGEHLVKERWIWKDLGQSTRQGWNAFENNWSENVPWGAPNVANSKRPEPHRVDAFDSPEIQANAIKDILLKALTDRVKNLKSANQNIQENEYHKLLNKVKELQKTIVQETQEQINEVNAELSVLISKVFPNYKIDFDAKPEDDLDKSINLFKSESQLLMGSKEGYLGPVEKQGSGARRTLLWTALKFISENKQKENESSKMRPHVLLIDEPEICLHPNAIRDASNVLYDLPSNSNWQVMVTTHSPIFIDFSRDNTTIVRVERKENGDINGTTVFRPDKVKLSNDDKQNLKLLNLCDPYVAEFFFGGNIIIVEGDTEYTAFKYIQSKNPNQYRDIHIIRARGKATIVSLIKILNQFGTKYSVLHDSDRPKTKNGKGNPAWGNNQNILNEVNANPKSNQTRLIASLPNFEEAYFGEEIKTEKPYNALHTISTDQEKYEIIEKLLKALINHNSELPINCVEWSNIEELERELDVKCRDNNSK
ncbi:MAG: AAA family ATPase [Candidatus Kapabacteria bacterium]|nr:AAA family ATPase [Candidatus Kapabacteria bacterium]